LLKVGDGTPDVSSEVERGFDAGVARSADLADGLLAALFRTRTAQLLDQRSRSWARGFLSGLLIGSEVASLSRQYSTTGNVYIIGESELTTLYQRVFERRGVAVSAIDGASCVVAGLRALRRHG
jgi:2-dehydro-3-deoxygalactonokinase